MNKIRYYTFREESGMGNFLLEDSNANEIFEKVLAEFGIDEENWEDDVDKLSRRGFLKITPFDFPLVAELEGQKSHYGRDEIKKNLIHSIPQELYIGGRNLHIISEKIINLFAIDGHEEFMAIPCRLIHKATNREWRNYWFVRFTFEIEELENIKGSAPYFTGKNGTPFYVSDSIKTQFDSLKIKGIALEQHQFEIKMS